MQRSHQCILRQRSRADSPSAASPAESCCVPDEHWGEAVKAVVELREGMHATEQQIIDFCRERLASFKKPKSVDFVKGLVGTSGKVGKRELRERYWQGRSRRVN